MSVDLTSDEMTFLKESNYIERVYDYQSYEDATKAWEYLRRCDDLTDEVVRRTHKMLMRRQKLRKDELGEYRKRNVGVIHDGKMRKCPDWNVVPSLMWHWLFEACRKSPVIEPIKLHVEYELIHPFIDGNGRTGRMFLNWMRIKKLSKPILIIYERDKDEYYSWFQ